MGKTTASHRAAQQLCFPEEESLPRMRRRRPGLKIAPSCLTSSPRKRPRNGGSRCSMRLAGVAAIIKDLGAEPRAAPVALALVAAPHRRLGTAPTRARRSTSTPIPPSRRDRCSNPSQYGMFDLANVDEEIGKICGPACRPAHQCAPAAPNAANARWGCSTMSPCCTDAILLASRAQGRRGARRQGDRQGQGVPRCCGAARNRQPHRRHRLQRRGGQLAVKLKSGNATALKNAAQFAGFQGDAAAPSAVLLANNGLHAVLPRDRFAAA